MELQIRYLLIVAVSMTLAYGYNTYPRNNRKSGDGVVCPSQCQCIKLNSRGTRDLFLMDWSSDEPWYSTKETDYQQDDSGDASGRSMICQGLRELPAPLPEDITKMYVYGDSSQIIEQGKQREFPRDQEWKTIPDTQIRYIDRHAFRGNSMLHELVLTGNNIEVLYPFIFHGLRNLGILSIQNNNVKHLSAAVFNGLTHLTELRLSDNKIRFLPSSVFNNLLDLTVLHLNGNKLKTIQKELFSPLTKLEKLDLSRNNISDFYDEIFDHNMQLKELLLDGNRLWMIRPRWFKNLYALESLSIRGNQITQLYSNSFVNLLNLKQLLLSANLINHMQDGALSNLQDLRVLDLSTNDLQDISKADFKDLYALRELYLTSNRLTVVPNDTFEFVTSLVKLDLSRNDLEGLHVDMFANLQKLQVLDLSHNKLQRIIKGIFTGLWELKDLKMNDNFIGVIENDAFNIVVKNHLSKLSSLNLANNNLKRLTAVTLRGIPNTKSLNLENNKLKRLHSMALSEFSNLASLSLRKNRIKNLDNGIFHGLKNLVDLDISENKIRAVSGNMFVGLNNLENLDIGKNQIRSIHKDAFTGCPNVIEINLEHNTLISFNFSMLQNLPKIGSLDLSNNQLFWIDVDPKMYLRLKDLVLSNNNLQTLSKRIVNLMGSSSIVSLEGNPWKCDCNLGWVVDDAINKHVRIDTVREALCKSPSRLHGFKVTDLNTEDFTCEQETTNKKIDMECQDGPFNKKSYIDKRTMNRKLIGKHVTVFDWRKAPVSNGILVDDDWALVGASALNHVPLDEIVVKLGHGKEDAKVLNVIKHPLLSMGMVSYDVALLQLKKGSFKGSVDSVSSCFLTKRQFTVISNIIPKFSVTANIRKGTRSKLKIRKGKLRQCKQKDFLCTFMKTPKKKTDILLNGSPLYVGHNNNLQLAGLGIQPSLSHDIKDVQFIPLWTISDWVSTVMQEYNKKCNVDKKNNMTCLGLNLPQASDLFAKLQHKETH